MTQIKHNTLKIITTFLLIFVTLSANAQFKLGSKRPLDKIANAEQLIFNLYVDTLNENKLAQYAIEGMLKQLDPHSSYSTPEEVKEMKEPLEGSFDGIGVQFNMLEDTLVVIQTTFNGPSEKAGIMPGDRIVEVNGVVIAGVKMSRTAIMKNLRGPKGTIAKLKIKRSTLKEPITFNVKRDKIPVKTVNVCYMIRPEIGYIKVESFGETTYKEFIEGVNNLRRLGMKTLILDLQDNGGGYLQTAVMMANEFLKDKEMIVYTQGRAFSRNDFTANGNGTIQNEKIIVLVNEFSASASEIVAGAIQDNDRGIVVGRRTFGKGLVQRPIEFDDGSMIKLTVSHYYTPAGRCIQKPYKKGDTQDYYKDFERRLKNGELTNPDSIHFDDSLKYSTLKKHRIVYGGGGIMPDTFVPLDTMKYTDFYRKLLSKNIIIEQNLKYIDKQRSTLKKQYTTFEDFLSNYETPKTFIDKIINEAEKQGLKPKDGDELQRTLPYLKIQLKALVARDIWDMSEYFQIINTTNDIVCKGISIAETGSLQ